MIAMNSLTAGLELKDKITANTLRDLDDALHRLDCASELHKAELVEANLLILELLIVLFKRLEENDDDLD